MLSIDIICLNILEINKALAILSSVFVKYSLSAIRISNVSLDGYMLTCDSDYKECGLLHEYLMDNLDLPDHQIFVTDLTMPNMHGIFDDAEDPADHESSENTMIDHTSDW